MVSIQADGQRWELVFDTFNPNAGPGAVSEENSYPLRERSLAVFRIQSAPEGPAAVVTPAQVENILAPAEGPLPVNRP